MLDLEDFYLAYADLFHSKEICYLILMADCGYEHTSIIYQCALPRESAQILVVNFV